MDGDHRRHDHLQGRRAEGVSGAGGLSRCADTQKEKLALHHGAEMREKQTDEGQEAPIRPQMPCAVFQALQEGDTGENRPALSGSGAGDRYGKRYSGSMRTFSPTGAPTWAANGTSTTA